MERRVWACWLGRHKGQEWRHMEQRRRKRKRHKEEKAREKGESEIKKIRMKKDLLRGSKIV